MNLIKDLNQTFNIVKQNKTIWWLSFLSLLYLLIPSRHVYDGKPFLFLLILPLSFISWVISTIAYGGLVYTSYQLYTAGDFVFDEICSKSKSRSFRILGIAVLLIPVGALMIGINYYIYSNNITLNWYFLEVFLSTLTIGPLMFFGMCAIVIHDLKALPAARISLLILTKNMISVFLVMINAL